MKKIIALLLLCFTVTNCEKDDICSDDTSTTSRLFVEFYNSSNTDNKKNVTHFLAQGIDNDVVLEGYNDVTTNEVYLPLKTTETETQFVLYKGYAIDEDDVVTGNPDTITISYTPKLKYVSKACGYKTVYENVTITILDDGNKWINNIESTTDNEPISNEDEAHFNFFH